MERRLSSGVYHGPIGSEKRPVHAVLSGLKHSLKGGVKIRESRVFDLAMEEERGSVHEVRGRENTISRLVRLAHGQVNLIASLELFLLVGHRRGTIDQVAIILTQVLANISQ